MAKIEVSHDRSFGFLLPLITIRERSLYNDTYSAEGNGDMFSRWGIKDRKHWLSAPFTQLINFLLALIKK